MLLFLSLTVDIGNWWVHKRHLQLQVDAAALAGGAFLGDCFSDSVGREHCDQERGDAVRRRRRLELQRPGRRREQGGDHAPLPEHDVRGRHGRTRRHRDAAPVQHAEPDVRRQGERGGPAADLPDSGPAQRRRDQRARARAAEAGRGAGRDAARRGARPAFQLRVRDLRERGHAAPSSGRWSWRRPARAATSSSGRHQRRSRVSIASAHVGVRIRLVGGADPNCRLRPAVTRSATTSAPTDGVVHIRGWSTGDRAERPQRLAAPRHLPAGRVLRDGRLQRRDPGRGRSRRDASSHRRRRDGEGVGDRRRRGQVPADAGRHDRARHLDARLGRLAPRRRRAAHRRPRAGAGSRPRARGTGRPARRRTTTRARTRGRSAPCSARSSPAGARARSQRVQVYESGVTTSGSNSFQTGRRTRSASASPSAAASRCSRWRPTR